MKTLPEPRVGNNLHIIRTRYYPRKQFPKTFITGLFKNLNEFDFLKFWYFLNRSVYCHKRDTSFLKHKFVELAFPRIQFLDVFMMKKKSQEHVWN